MENNLNNMEIDEDINYYEKKVLPDQDKSTEAYERTFNVILNILMDSIYLEERNKKFNIIQTVIKNILSSPSEDKFKKLKLYNKNIQALFEINGLYDFFTYLGFIEEFIDGELYLCLYNPDLEILSIIYSYMTLLIVNEEDLNDNVYIEDINNPIEYSSQCERNYYQDNKDLVSRAGRKNIKKSIVDILKETKDIRLNGPIASNYSNQSENKINIISKNSNNFNQPSSKGANNKIIVGKNINKDKVTDIKAILKETANVRKNNFDYVASNNIRLNNNPISSSNNNPSRFMTLSDIKYSNPEIDYIFKNNYVVKDEIGKKCLELTNEFRKKNGLGPLYWEDNVWKISFEHSRNMGIRKVKFGHDGFNDRIRTLPFYFSLACENVFMCQGISEFRLAEMAVDGWINSPGHRKNLLSSTSHCSIAVFRNSYFEFFLTQIFVRK